MTQYIANVSPTNTYEYWRNRTNELTNAVSTYVVTYGATNNADVITTGSFQGANIYVSNSAGSNAVLYSGNTIFANSAEQVLDQFPLTQFRSADYIINLTDTVGNNFHTARLVTVHDAGVAYSTEYATIYTNTSIGVFRVTVTGANVQVLCTPSNSSITAAFFRTGLKK